MSSQTQLRALFDLQRARRSTLRNGGAHARRDRLQRLGRAIRAHVAEIDAALQADLRKMPLGLDNPEIAAPLHDIEVALEELDAWMSPVIIEPSPQFAGNRTYIQYEPRGTCLLFGPWNFPFALVMQPLVAILAAGNSAIVKPNELAPATSGIIARVLAEAFGAHEVTCIEGGIDTSEALLDLPFDHIFFTGSPSVGRHIMAAASRHLSSVTLELGGKCPAILDDGIDLEAAAAKVAAARYYNAGQLCLSVDHVWLHESQSDAFVGHLRSAVAALFYADGVLLKPRLSRMVNGRNFERVKNALDEAVARGARLVMGGTCDASDLTIHPTALTGVPLDTALMREEIFGPVLPILTYQDVGDVFEFIDRGGKPLALYVFSRRAEFIDQVLEQTSSGGVTVNDVLLHAVEARLPFGGVNQSGTGRYKGIHGFRELSNAKSVFVSLGCAS